MSAEMYGVGAECTWHGPLTFAADGKGVDIAGNAIKLCPSCGGRLKLTTVEQFWTEVASSEKQRPSYELLMTWSEGKCYPDFETMENAWRQAMEGQQ